MLTRAQEKMILSLHHKNGRQKTGFCLLEGEKVIATAGDAVEYVFTEKDSDRFDTLVTTQTPQLTAAVARIPEWDPEELLKRHTIVVLDGVQDPGNVGGILRLCLGFGAALVLVDCADVSSPKVVRSSVGALFHVPWIKVARDNAEEMIAHYDRPVFRLEKNDGAQPIDALQQEEKIVLVAGSEGSGIHLQVAGTSVAITHDTALESLNVSHALAIALHMRQ